MARPLTLLVGVSLVLYVLGFRPHHWLLRALRIVYAVLLLGRDAQTTDAASAGSHGNLAAAVYNVTTDVQTVSRVLHEFFQQPDVVHLQLEERFRAFLSARAGRSFGRVERALDWLVTVNTVCIAVWVLRQLTHALAPHESPPHSGAAGKRAHGAAGASQRKSAVAAADAARRASGGAGVGRWPSRSRAALTQDEPAAAAKAPPLRADTYQRGAAHPADGATNAGVRVSSLTPGRRTSNAALGAWWGPGIADGASALSNDGGVLRPGGQYAESSGVVR